MRNSPTTWSEREPRVSPPGLPRNSRSESPSSGEPGGRAARAFLGAKRPGGQSAGKLAVDSAGNGFGAGMMAAASPLVSTRISEREHRPRSLCGGLSVTYSQVERPVVRRQPARQHALSPLPQDQAGSTTQRNIGPAVRTARPRLRGPGRTAKHPRQSSSERAHAVVIPRHVQACQWSAFGHEKWFVWTWRRGVPAVKTRVPYSCNSWRCEVCRRHEAAVTFARIKEATRREGYVSSGWVFIVLTLDRDGYYSGKAWVDTDTAYRELSRMSRNFLARLRRAFNGAPGSSWVAVVEAHRTGWPHMNLLLYAPELASELEASRVARIEAGATERQSLLLSGKLLSAATATGWGTQSTAEVAHSQDAIAGYIVKLAGEADATNGELAKITQAPTNAPQRFRRLRSGKGFLPPRRSNPNITGVLVRRRRSPEGDWEICRINPSKDPEAEQPIREAVVAEVAVIREEEGLLAKHRTLPPMPPLRLAVGSDLEDWRRSRLQNDGLDGLSPFDR